MRKNIIDLSCREGDLFCPFCGATIWNAESPDDLKACEHFIFSYGQGGFFLINPILLKALQDADILDEDTDDWAKLNNEPLQKELIICHKLFANFIVFSEDMVGDLGLTAIAEYPYQVAQDEAISE